MATSVCGHVQKVMTCENSAWALFCKIESTEGGQNSSSAQLIMSHWAGKLLVNSSVAEQKCIACEPNTYTTHDALGCRQGLGYGKEMSVCETRSCLACPEGLTCLDGKAVIPDDGSIWKREGDHFRISSCPPGSLVHRSSGEELRNAQFDRCVACGYGSYSLQRSYYSGNGSENVIINGTVQPILTTFGNSQSLLGKCIACPAGAICEGGSSVVPKQNYWRGCFIWSLWCALSGRAVV